MQTTKQISLFLFLFVWTIARCYPSKPLNERSTELTWQAWLLIDESQNKQQDNTLKRRITPKSVFIAPTFSPESLPECSEGYQSDPMGRCIKIIMLNKELHLDFLLQQLNQKFGGMEDYEYEEETTTGPLNINIPLNAVQEETDVAIVVAPTKNLGQTAMEMEINMNKTLSEEKVNVADIAGILGLKQIAEVETTTITGSDTTTQELTTETSTANTQGTTSELNALFFLDSKRQVEVKTDSTTSASTTLASTISNTGSTEYDALKTTTERQASPDNDLTLYQMDQALPYSDSSVTFVDIKREAIKGDKKASANGKTTERPPTAFTVRSTLMVPKKQQDTFKYEFPLPKVSTPAPFKVPQYHDSTTVSLQFTPVDNGLSIDHSTIPTETTNSFFSNGFQKLNHQTTNDYKNKKIFSQLGVSSEGITVHKLPETTSDYPGNSKVTDSGKIIFPTRSFMVRFPAASHHVRFPTSSSSSSSTTSTTYSSDISDRFGEDPRTTSSDQSHTLPTISATPSHSSSSQVDLTSLYERLKAHRENHRNREKHSEWFHLPTKWSDTSHKPLVLRFSRKNGHVDTQEFGTTNFFRQFDARVFGFKPTITR